MSEKRTRQNELFGVGVGYECIKHKAPVDSERLVRNTGAVLRRREAYTCTKVDSRRDISLHAEDAFILMQ
jgi:hypothetical protein